MGRCPRLTRAEGSEAAAELSPLTPPSRVTAPPPHLNGEELDSSGSSPGQDGNPGAASQAFLVDFTMGRSGSTRSAQATAPTTRIAAEMMNGRTQWLPCARTPNTKGEMAPAMLADMFMIPDRVPACAPATSLGTDHHGPVISSMKNSDNARHITEA